MKPNEIKVGDVVVLAGDDRQPMTVEKIIGEAAACVWFAGHPGTWSLCRENINIGALKPHKPPEQDMARSCLVRRWDTGRDGPRRFMDICKAHEEHIATHVPAFMSEFNLMQDWHEGECTYCGAEN